MEQKGSSAGGWVGGGGRVSMARRRRGGGRAPDVCEKSDWATVFGTRKTGHRMPTDASDWRKQPCTLFIYCYVAAVTSVGTGS